MIRELFDIGVGSFRQGLMITVFVFVMMMIIDYFNVLSKGKFSDLVRGKKYKQYFITPFLGALPGCLGAFTNVSLYMRGLITFGALAGGMIAASGDEAFIMLSLFPGTAVLLFGILFVIGAATGFLIDKTVKCFRLKPSVKCEDFALHDDKDCRILSIKEIVGQLRKMSFARFLLLAFVVTAVVFLIFGIIGPETWDWIRITFLLLMGLAFVIIISVPDHYLERHVWEHIFKKHLWKIFLWSFGVILIMDIGLHYWDIESFIKANMIWVILIAGLIGLIPESGPHLIFVMLFSRGLIPFSVLLVSSIVQDGHGMLPLLSYSLRDSFILKSFNLAIGLALGFGLFLFGL